MPALLASLRMPFPCASLAALLISAGCAIARTKAAGLIHALGTMHDSLRSSTLQRGEFPRSTPHPPRLFSIRQLRLSRLPSNRPTCFLLVAAPASRTSTCAMFCRPLDLVDRLSTAYHTPYLKNT
ncbi:hypothetical protein OBBRIDRAFT_215326 [Obba rivulosa]|uniref:Secreted protein n=1 Tax=Obba rivulosa TaxID=1052685 RepID=A0A8E2DQK0_9APHY|nr:hypothetical protein OBBRIDRAFT_215326 [Obba rivulosa]